MCLVLALLGSAVCSCFLMGEDTSGPNNFGEFTWTLSGVKTDQQEQAAIHHWNQQLLGSGAFLDSYDAWCLDESGNRIPNDDVPRWIYEYPSKELWVAVKYRRGGNADIHRHKLVNPENWWRFMLRE
jgi:hypothetical protein